MSIEKLLLVVVGVVVFYGVAVVVNTFSLAIFWPLLPCSILKGSFKKDVTKLLCYSLTIVTLFYLGISTVVTKSEICEVKFVTFSY